MTRMTVKPVVMRSTDHFSVLPFSSPHPKAVAHGSGRAVSYARVISCAGPLVFNKAEYAY